MRRVIIYDPVAYKRREVGDHYLTGYAAEVTLYTWDHPVDLSQWLVAELLEVKTLICDRRVVLPVP